VVVFHPPLPNSFERDFIKRVIGVPGDHVQVRDGRVFVNGRELQEQYLRSTQTFCGGQWCDITLGPDEYYVMGDNRTNSSDSRLWGPVPGQNIIGKTLLIYLPFDDFGPAPNQKPGVAVASGGTSSR
jgi:signal peptidase I